MSICDMSATSMTLSSIVISLTESRETFLRQKLSRRVVFLSLRFQSRDHPANSNPCDLAISEITDVRLDFSVPPVALADLTTTPTVLLPHPEHTSASSSTQIRKRAVIGKAGRRAEAERQGQRWSHAAQLLACPREAGAGGGTHGGIRCTVWFGAAPTLWAGV